MPNLLPSQQPIDDAPIIDAPVVDAPIMDAPIDDEPINDEPTDDDLFNAPIPDPQNESGSSIDLPNGVENHADENFGEI